MKQISVTVEDLITHLQTFTDKKQEVFIVSEEGVAIPIVQLAETTVRVDGDDADRPCVIIVPSGSPTIDELAAVTTPN